MAFLDEKVGLPALWSKIKGLFNKSITGLSIKGKIITFTKGDGTTGTIETQDTNTTYGEATTESPGLLSAKDKAKLDSIASGAQVNTVTGVKGNAETAYRTGQVNLTPDHIGALPASGTAVNASKVANKLTITGGATGTYDGSAPVTVTIPPAVSVKGGAEANYRTGQVNLTTANIGAYPLTGGILNGNIQLGSSSQTTLPIYGIGVHDIRSVPTTSLTPKTIQGNGHNVNFYFMNNSQGVPSGILDWASVMRVTGWAGDTYATWLLAGPASTRYNEKWYLRAGIGDTWSDWREILHSGNYKEYCTPANINAVAKTGDTMTGTLGFNWGSGGKKGLSFYSPSYYTWYEYMGTSSGTSVACPTGSTTDASAGGITSWAMRSLIENTNNYGWIWESCKNGVNEIPVAMAALSSANGNMWVKGSVTAASFVGNASSATVANGVKDVGGGDAVTFNYSGSITTTKWIAAFDGDTKVIRAISPTNLRTAIGALASNAKATSAATADNATSADTAKKTTGTLTISGVASGSFNGSANVAVSIPALTTAEITAACV